ncbi:PTS fructose transporter subunit IIABC [Dietzia cinnamea]|uniref:PTS system D-fructose-specific IIA component (F1P-forming) (Frc family) /PTS system D-fructose-specific IIB component (F1P-forming) (Frc family) /PTS system D-fructose-specific IIC component (F1P-f... n=1 Tax=Dietzia cinnamea TaxID=321318 RepID=A0A4V2W7U7_9ACTN|nr:fructose-specific PTS transporter subunit EIIC [Dietzia cinnamea]MCT2264859.1 fructose-specific PTS transporter subunit EIIC [Dietzia cinnamea]TCW23360.1 PTS system D-fructose-specific IIA component (F1P-forming) (Frc family) /PTS system D-fructose-specific IIB component (F1P-forming) (Frc family) /PTS system D-fructose-specific IIC component (F1P-forming) (Frc family) [Dietzia cinnamea]
MNQPIIETAAVRLDADLGGTKQEVIRALARTLVDAGRADDHDALVRDLLAREDKAATGMKGGIAIPHCKSEAVTSPSLAFARLDPPVDFGAKDGPADLVLMIGAPAGGGKEHLKLLATLARNLVRAEFVDSLRAAATAEDAVAAIEKVLAAQEQKASSSPAPTESGAGAVTTPDGGGAATTAGGAMATAGGAGTPTSGDGDAPLRLVAVTACPTGIAHTYMAADSLAQAAQARGVDLQVETQGSAGATVLDPGVIEAADAVVFATDVGVRDRGRFAGKPVVEYGVKKAIDAPDRVLDEALAAARDPRARRVSADSGDGSGTAASGASGADEHWARGLQRAVMTGVSYMIPFVAAGGLLLALGFLFAGYDVAFVWQELSTSFTLTDLPGEVWYLDGEIVSAGTAGAEVLTHTGLRLYIGAVLFAIGQAAMGFMIAVLSGYIAYGLADRPGIAPGFVGGALSATLGAGFIGALVTGILAGYLVRWMTTWKTPRWLSGLMPVVLIPLIGSLAIGLLMFLLLGRPLASLTSAMESWLGGMTGSSVILLGVILGLMMCFDLGGPVNKAAYTFATAGLVADNPATLRIMAAVMAAGMVPPLAMGLATVVRKRLFSPAEQENGRAAFLLGASFITEGAIPFAAADPLRVIPSMMAGGAVTGALIMAFSVESYAPHGGLFVVFAISPVWGYLVAILAGTLVACAAVVTAKSARRTPAVAPAAAAEPVAA